MTIYFGENLKRLRKEKELTQETLAEFFGVSFQTISKWERGETYPDITMLPAISSFFNVSIDDLLGADKAQKEQQVNEYLELYDQMRLKDVSLTFRKFQKAVKEFPGIFPILIRYMELLMEEKDSVLLPDYEKTSGELMSIYENIQNHCTDDDIRIWSKRLMIEHFMRKYQCLGFDEAYKTQAQSIVNTLPAMKDSREYNLPELDFDPKKWYENRRNAIEELSYLLQNVIISYCYYDEKFTPEYKIEVMKHMNGIFHMIDSDEHYSKNRMHIIYNYGHLGHLYCEVGDREQAIKYLKIAAEYAKAFDENPDMSEGISRFYEKEERFREMNMCERMKQLFTKHYPLPEDFKETFEFKEIIALLDG